MSIELAMISQAQPYMLRARAGTLIQREVCKGCLPDISRVPVALEPPFHPAFAPNEVLLDGEDDQSIPEASPGVGELVRLQVWVSPDQPFDWNRHELFLKQLSQLPHRVGFEIVGNEKSITVTLLCHRTDMAVVMTAFGGEFQSCVARPLGADMLSVVPEERWNDVLFNEYFPPPPYSHPFTTPEELKVTAFESLFVAMKNTPVDALCLYQFLLQGARPTNNWHRNLAMMLDYEYIMKSLSSGYAPQRYLQQTPSGDLRQMSVDAQNKAHDSKPIFFAVVRTCVIGADRNGAELLRALSTCMSLFQHGGRPLSMVTNVDYSRRVSPSAFRNILYKGLTHRPGFLANSLESTPMLPPFCCPKILESQNISTATLETLPPTTDALSQGTLVGECQYADLKKPICIPPGIRFLSTHVISVPEMGKTALISRICLSDIEEGCGAVFIDAHGDGVKGLLRLIPRRFYEKTIYFNPGDPHWIPLWNPLHVPPGGDIYRMVNDIVSVFKRVMDDWGDRMEHVIRNGLIGLSYLGNMTLLDLYNLTRQGTAESEQLRQRIIRVAVDEPVRKFWQADFLEDYRKADLAAPRHKMSKLVTGGSVSKMLSQWENKIGFSDIIDNGKILLVDLSDLGAEVRQILGSVILDCFLMASLGRSKESIERRHPFSIFVDEAHLFVGADAIEDMIAQVRKFRIRLCVAHQYLAQFKTPKIDALSSAGSTLIGRIDKHDAQFFQKHLQDKVDVKDLISLEKHQMIAKIGTDIVRMRTLPLPAPPKDAAPQEIIESTHRNYCKPVHEVEEAISRRDERSYGRFSSLSTRVDETGVRPEDLRYDEFN